MVGGQARSLGARHGHQGQGAVAAGKAWSLGSRHCRGQGTIAGGKARSPGARHGRGQGTVATEIKEAVIMYKKQYVIRGVMTFKFV